MNDSDSRLKDGRTDERPPKGGERRPDSLFLTGDFDPGRSRPFRIVSERVTIWVIVLFWATVFLLFTAEQFMNKPPGPTIFVWPRLIGCVVGALISFGIVAGQSALRDRTLAVRASAAVPMALAAAALAAAVNYPIFLPFMKGLEISPFWRGFLFDFLVRIWTFGLISAIILAITYAVDIRDREQRISALQALAHSAQLRALRNQLNPHFLFNALNSIAGLMSQERGREAEQMTENLADFLRITLALDPQKLISLAEEVRLQELYLRIEKVRFPERLFVTTQIPAELSDALVPALITQPLIENSLKYAVARSTEAVRLYIGAREVGQSIELVIEDDGGNAQDLPSKGASLGLTNVAERLRTHYGSSAGFEAGKTAAGGFRNVITIPAQ